MKCYKLYISIQDKNTSYFIPFSILKKHNVLTDIVAGLDHEIATYIINYDEYYFDVRNSYKYPFIMEEMFIITFNFKNLSTNKLKKIFIDANIDSNININNYDINLYIAPNNYNCEEKTFDTIIGPDPIIFDYFYEGLGGNFDVQNEQTCWVAILRIDYLDGNNQQRTASFPIFSVNNNFNLAQLNKNNVIDFFTGESLLNPRQNEYMAKFANVQKVTVSQNWTKANPKHCETLSNHNGEDVEDGGGGGANPPPRPVAEDLSNITLNICDKQFDITLNIGPVASEMLLVLHTQSLILKQIFGDQDRRVKLNAVERPNKLTNPNSIIFLTQNIPDDFLFNSIKSEIRPMAQRIRVPYWPKHLIKDGNIYYGLRFGIEAVFVFDLTYNIKYEGCRDSELNFTDTIRLFDIVDTLVYRQVNMKQIWDDHRLDNFLQVENEKDIMIELFSSSFISPSLLRSEHDLFKINNDNNNVDVNIAKIQEFFEAKMNENLSHRLKDFCKEYEDCLTGIKEINVTLNPRTIDLIEESIRAKTYSVNIKKIKN